MRRLSQLPSSLYKECFSDEETLRIVDNIWGAYEDLTNGLESDLRKVAEGYLAERCPDRAVPFVSLLAPVLFAEPFGVRDQDVIIQTGIAGLCFDHFTHLVDDITDKPGGSDLLSVHLGSLLLARGMAICCELVSDSGAFVDSWQAYLHEASEGERFLWRHRGILKPYRDVDLVMLGRRGSLAKTSAAVFAGVSGRWELLSQIEDAVNSAATAIQIVDDYLDWEEDLTGAMFTYPIFLAHGETKSMDPDSLQRALVRGESGRTTLELAERLVKKAACRLEGLKASKALSVLQSLSESLSNCLALMSHFADASDQQAQSPSDLMDRLRKELQPRMQH
ncbi:hypothetical protein ACFLS5_01360 [Candidatus Bipolaricaulota bacterium]